MGDFFVDFFGKEKKREKRKKNPKFSTSFLRMVIPLRCIS